MMAHIPKTRINNPSAKNCGNISRTYFVNKALQILSHIHYFVFTNNRGLKFEILPFYTSFWQSKGINVRTLTFEQIWWQITPLRKVIVSLTRNQYSYSMLALYLSQQFQAMPGNDQNASPTNRKTAESKLEQTS